jgi:hypothetical protein
VSDPVFLYKDQVVTWKNTIDNASELYPFKAILVESYNALATMQVGQWPIISAIIGQTNLFEDVRRKFPLGLLKFEDHFKHVLEAFTRAQARTATPCGVDARPGPDRLAASQLMPATAQSPNLTDKSSLTPVNVVLLCKGLPPLYWTVLSLSS